MSRFLDTIEANGPADLNPKPFVWTRTADEILASIPRLAQRTHASVQPS